MPLPSFASLRVRRREMQHEKSLQKREQNTEGGLFEDNSSSSTTTPTAYKPGVDIKRATKTRKNAIIISSLLFFISTVFLILVVIGNINTRDVIRSTYFFRLDLSSVYPQAFGGADLVLVNSIARSIGLRDFYQVGLWNYCEGYNDEGITSCSPSTPLYWFNPISIILSSLLSGATIRLPTNLLSILSLIRLASHLMYGFYLASLPLNLLLVFLAPLALRSRWWSLPLSILTFITALLTVAASVIATVMFIIFRDTVTSQPGLSIRASLGKQMMAFMWVAAGCSFLGFGIHISMACCCASRRDVRTGRRVGSKKAYGDVGVLAEKETERRERKGRRRVWGGRDASAGREAR